MLINSLPCNWTLTVQSLVSLSFSIFHTGRIWPWNLQALLISSPDTCLTRSPYESYDHTYHDTTKFAALKAFPNHAVDTDSPLSLFTIRQNKKRQCLQLSKIGQKEVQPEQCSVEQTGRKTLFQHVQSQHLLTVIYRLPGEDE